MGVFRQFPYSNFHEMNMDEIIKIIKNMLEEWAQYHAEWDQWMADLEESWSEYQDDVNAQWAAYQNTMNTAWQSMQNFINNYFDNLDVQEEINNKIVSMIQSGEFGLLVNEYIPPAVSAWLNLNITQPTGVVIDKSLTVAGACADAKATGDAINKVNSNLEAVADVLNMPETKSGTNTISAVYTLENVVGGLTLKSGITYEITVSLNQVAPAAIYLTLKDSSANTLKSFSISDASSSVETYVATADVNGAYIDVQSSALSVGTVVTATVKEIGTFTKIESIDGDIKASNMVDGIIYGSGSAVSPAYTVIPLLNMTMEYGKTYTIYANADTDSENYSVYLQLFQGETQLDQHLITHSTGHIQYDYTAQESANVSLVYITNLTNGINVSAAICEKIEKPVFHSFFDKYLYHHMNQETGYTNCVIPAQSLPDIAFAYSMGFKAIEANIHECSDGVFVCKHGNAGKLGAGLKTLDDTDCSDILFSDVSSTWLRTNVVYDSPMTKYQLPIPTLDEFCAECKAFGMKIIIEANTDALSIVRKYMTDDNIVMVGADNRDNGFTGTIEYVKTVNKSTLDAVAECRKIGRPVYMVIASGTLQQYTDAEIVELTTLAHANGIDVGIVYPTANTLVKMKSLGIDSAGATNNDINIFTHGTDCNVVDLDDPTIVTDGTYDATNDTITLQTNDTLVINNDGIKAGIVSVSIRYSGTITVGASVTELASDGNSIISFAYALEPNNTTYTSWFTLTANSNTTIYDLKVSASVI